MKFTTHVKVLPLFLAAFATVFGSPIPVTMKVNDQFLKPWERGILEQSMVDINNKYIPAMKRGMDSYKTSKSAHAALQASFGKDYEAHLDTIKANVQKLHDYHVVIGHPYEQLDALVSFIEKTKEIWVEPGLFRFWHPKNQIPKSPAEDRLAAATVACAMIHELTHGAFNSVDRFHRSDYKPIYGKDTAKDDYFGYLRNDFRHLRDKAGANAMVANADSYMVFAQLMAVGDVDISPQLTKDLWSSEGSKSRTPSPQKVLIQ